MTVKINADTSDGLKFVSDTSGTVDIQSNGTTKFSVGSTIDCQGNELVLDADADTSIHASTDDQIDFKTGGTDRMVIDSSGNLKFNSGYGSVVTAYGVRAWVNFDGTSMGIRASGNVSSISDRGTGKFTVNLSVATPDDDGAVLVTSSNSSTASSGEKTNGTGVQNSTSALYINLRDSSNNSQKDSNYVHVAYLR